MSEKLDMGPGSQHHEPETSAEAAKFDHEIHLKGILYSAAGLVIVTALALFGMWWMLRGFAGYDTRHDVRRTPIEAANPQQPPPEPRLQVAGGFNLLDAGQGGKALEQSDREDMAAELEKEESDLSQPLAIDAAQGLVRVPIDVAMQVIARRGVAPEVVGGRAGAASPPAPVPSPPQPPGTGGKTSPSEGKKP